jgi:hypothetical protein
MLSNTGDHHNSRYPYMYLQRGPWPRLRKINPPRIERIERIDPRASTRDITILINISAHSYSETEFVLVMIYVQDKGMTKMLIYFQFFFVDSLFLSFCESLSLSR